MFDGVDFWPIVERLAAALDGNREASELALDKLESELRLKPRSARDEIRRNMILVVAGLSRLEVRLVATDGPLETSI